MQGVPAFHVGQRVQPQERRAGSKLLRHGGIGLRDVSSELLFVGLVSRGYLGVVNRTVCGFFRCQDQFSPHSGQLSGRPLLNLLFHGHCSAIPFESAAAWLLVVGRSSAPHSLIDAMSGGPRQSEYPDRMVVKWAPTSSGGAVDAPVPAGSG